MMISILGVRTDRQTRFWNPHMETCRHTKNFNSKLKISGWLSIPICLNGGRGCIIMSIMVMHQSQDFAKAEAQLIGYN